MKRILAMTMASVWFTGAATAADAGSGRAMLVWDATVGVQVCTPVATIQWDQNDQLAAPVLKTAGGERPLKNPHVIRESANRLSLVYEVTTPDGTALKVTRELALTGRDEEIDVVETFDLAPEKPIATDLEIQRPFAILGAKAGATASAVCPLFNGWARPYPLSEKPLDVEYRLGNVLGGKGAERLALPVIQLDGQGAWRAAVSADCRFSALFSVLAAQGKAVQGVVRYRYACGKVPLAGTEKRTFGLWLVPAPPVDEPFGKSVDSFFRLMLPDVPPGPKWLHEIAMVYYDYLSENGQGWERDVHELARLLNPEERRRVALCFHGWYETIGGYSYDDSTGRMKTEWTAMDRTRKVRLSEEEVKRRLRLARQLGFRVLWYFADGMLQDSQAPFLGCYHPDWDWQDANGNRRTGWQGPDTWGKTYARNPAHPEVVEWYGRYLRALLAAYGPDVDGFVWDETNYIPLGMTSQKPQPAYCDRAMLDLMKALRQQVKAADRDKVFLASDCTGAWGSASYAMMADGTFQDSHCRPSAWSYGFFPNWRNTLWSCNWGAVSHFSWTRWGVENLGTSVSISNGYGDDNGPSEWDPKCRDAVVDLFRKRSAREPVRFLTDDPAQLLAGSPESPPRSDPIPAPAAGEINWALAAHGSQAVASSEYSRGCGPKGLIDGVRDNANWLHGHGWASQADQPLPQWIEIVFPQPRSISRFVIITYGTKDDSSSVATWGVKNYDIEVWDTEAKSWKTVASEKQDRVMLNRVHILEQPALTSRFRVVVRAVAPIDGIARLLQVEAWGKP
jgi:hypothetical protein